MPLKQNQAPTAIPSLDMPMIEPTWTKVQDEPNHTHFIFLFCLPESTFWSGQPPIHSTITIRCYPPYGLWVWIEMNPWLRSTKNSFGLPESLLLHHYRPARPQVPDFRQRKTRRFDAKDGPFGAKTLATEIWNIDRFLLPFHHVHYVANDPKDRMVRKRNGYFQPKEILGSSLQNGSASNFGFWS